MNTAIINLADEGMIYEKYKYIIKYLFLIKVKCLKPWTYTLKPLSKRAYVVTH